MRNEGPGMQVNLVKPRAPQYSGAAGDVRLSGAGVGQTSRLPVVQLVHEVQAERPSYPTGLPSAAPSTWLRAIMYGWRAKHRTRWPYEVRITCTIAMMESALAAGLGYL